MYIGAYIHLYIKYILSYICLHMCVCSACVSMSVWGLIALGIIFSNFYFESEVLETYFKNESFESHVSHIFRN